MHQDLAFIVLQGVNLVMKQAAPDPARTARMLAQLEWHPDLGLECAGEQHPRPFGHHAASATGAAPASAAGKAPDADPEATEPPPSAMDAS